MEDINMHEIQDQRFFGFAHDIREQNEAKVHALRLERLAAIGQRISVVAHESRNLMQRMSANLEMAALDCEDRPEAVGYILRARAAQKDLEHLFEELRNFSGPLTLRLQSCRLDYLLDQVLNEVSMLTQDREIRLHPHERDDDWWCEVDPFRICQVFRNLIENSVAAGPDPLSIELKLSDAELNGRPAVHLIYRDNGPGLDAEQRRKIFEPFFTTKAQGTGLGMSISKRIVEAHGGRLALGENAFPGAEFHITLPRQSFQEN